MSTMNFKAFLGKKIHKLPQGLNSFDELLFVIRTIFSQKLPEQYTFKYEDSDKDWIGLESQEDFEAAIGFFKENNINSMKIKIVKSTKPALDQYVVKNFSDEMSQSRIIKLSKKDEEEEDLNESVVINKDQNKEEHKGDQNQNRLSDVSRGQQIEVIQQNNLEQEQKNEIQNKEEQYVSSKRNSGAGLNNIQNQIEQQKVQENQKVLELNSSQKIQLTLDELQKMIEDVVEQKIKTLLSNYNLVPKNDQEQIAASQQEYLNKLTKLNHNFHQVEDNQEERKEDLAKQPDSNSRINSSQISDSLYQSDQEKKRPRAMLKTDPPAELKVEVGTPYVWSFKIENNGVSSWPKYTYFKCLQGPHKDQKIELEQLKPQGVIEIQIPLEAPLKPNKYQEIWSLVQEVPEKPVINFGPKVRYTLIVLEEQNVQEDKNKAPLNNQPIQKPSISISDPQNNGKVNSKILDLAKQLSEILGGDVKKYIEFVKLDNHQKLQLEELINIYIDNQKF
ncbi:hypothetical protein ABPG74_000764 [Tetrahymena malaccensis]